MRHQRTKGLDIRVASINDPDRPEADLTGEEREEAAGTYDKDLVERMLIAAVCAGGFGGMGGARLAWGATADPARSVLLKASPAVFS